MHLKRERERDARMGKTEILKIFERKRKILKREKEILRRER